MSSPRRIVCSLAGLTGVLALGAAACGSVSSKPADAGTAIDGPAAVMWTTHATTTRP
jgi:ABC-type glycerol-3-phosphate transport system substrate-binding protein